MRLSNSAAKFNLKRAIISNRVSHAGDPVSIVASSTFLVASRKAVAEHPFAVERSIVLCSSCPYKQRAGNITEVSAIANFTRAVSNYALFF